MSGAGLTKISDFDKLMMDKPGDETTMQDIEVRVGLIYEGFKEGCRIGKVDFDITIDDIFAEMTENPDLFARIIMEFTESQAPANNGDDKKKANQMMK